MGITSSSRNYQFDCHPNGMGTIRNRHHNMHACPCSYGINYYYHTRSIGATCCSKTLRYLDIEEDMAITLLSWLHAYGDHWVYYLQLPTTRGICRSIRAFAFSLSTLTSRKYYFET